MHSCQTLCHHINGTAVQVAECLHVCANSKRGMFNAWWWGVCTGAFVMIFVFTVAVFLVGRNRAETVHGKAPPSPPPASFVPEGPPAVPPTDKSILAGTAPGIEEDSERTLDAELPPPFEQ